MRNLLTENTKVNEDYLIRNANWVLGILSWPTWNIVN